MAQLSQVEKGNFLKLFNRRGYVLNFSTNDFCKSLAIKGEKNAIVIAREQTKGKGRLNRSFYSPKDSGIYMSILLTPDLKPEDSTLITTTAAVAVSLAIDKISGRKRRFYRYYW